jgi:hypothetical protein
MGWGYSSVPADAPDHSELPFPRNAVQMPNHGQTEALPIFLAEFLEDLATNPLLTDLGVSLVVFRLLDLLANHT